MSEGSDCILSATFCIYSNLKFYLTLCQEFIAKCFMNISEGWAVETFILSKVSNIHSFNANFLIWSSWIAILKCAAPAAQVWYSNYFQWKCTWSQPSWKISPQFYTFLLWTWLDETRCHTGSKMGKISIFRILAVANEWSWDKVHAKNQIVW